MKNILLAAVAAASFAAVAAEPAPIVRGNLKLVFNDCPKCPMRMKFSADGREASLNTARVPEAERAALVERAFALMTAAQDAKKPSLKRPLTGWSSWNTFALNISHQIITDTAKAMATNGLKEAGFLYVNIDDGFFLGHDANGRLVMDQNKFPGGMKPTVDAIHALGLKAGTYSDAGADACGGAKGVGLYGHDDDDCRLHFLEEGFDFIKVDYCGGGKLGLDERTRYTEISQAIRRTGRTDVRFNICRWGFPGVWAADIAESWRMSGDIRANWKSVKEIIEKNRYLAPYASVGHYNDMDMLEVGQLKGLATKGAFKEDTGLTPEEELTHLGMWCMLSSPLLIGCDVRSIPPQSLERLTNPFLLGMNQNDLGVQGAVVWRNRETYVFAKDCGERDGRARYAAFYNADDWKQDFTVPFAALDLAGPVEVLDLATRCDEGVVTGGVFKVTVEPHATRFYRFDAAERLERTVYEAEDAFLTEYNCLRWPRDGEFAYPEDSGDASCGAAVYGLGSRPTNDLVWKDVRLFRDGPVTLELSTRSLYPKTVFMQIDGGTPIKLEVPASKREPNWKMPFVKSLVKADLKKGRHVIRVFNDTAPLPAVDCLRIVR